MPNFGKTGAGRPDLVLIPGGMDQLADYERWLRNRGLSRKTVELRTAFALRWLNIWGTLTPSTEEIVRWLDQYSGWTRRTYHSHLHSIFGWLTDTGLLAHSPLAGVRRNRSPQPRPRPLSAVEVRRALDTDDERLRAFLMLGLYAGLRAHEIAKIHGHDVDESAIYVLGKGGQGASVPTHPELWGLAQQMPRTGHWFPSSHRSREHISASLVGHAVSNHFRRLGIEGSIHRTRATYGTNLLRNGVNLRVIQDLMRHSALSSTEHYLSVTDDDRRAAIVTLAA